MIVENNNNNYNNNKKVNVVVLYTQLQCSSKIKLIKELD